MIWDFWLPDGPNGRWLFITLIVVALCITTYKIVVALHS